MKVAFLSDLYPEYLRRFYALQPGLRSAPLGEQTEALVHDGFGWADFWSAALTRLGHECLDVWANALFVQRAWARENAFTVPGTERNPAYGIALEQLRRFKPEVLCYASDDADLLRHIRSRVPSLRLVLGWVGSALPPHPPFSETHLVLSCAPESVLRLRKDGVRAEHLNHAFEPRINERVAQRGKTIDLSFVGQIVRRAEFHIEREGLLEELASSARVEIFSPTLPENLVIDYAKTAVRTAAYIGAKALKRAGASETSLRRIPVVKKAADLKSRPRLSISAKLRPFVKPGVFGLEMYSMVKRSRVALNIHADSSPTHASNMRLFEITGVGTCQLTDWRDNLPELFEPDREVVTYRSMGECLEKARWLLAHPDEREQIAKRGQERTLRDHTFAKRAVELDGIIQREIRAV